MDGSQGGTIRTSTDPLDGFDFDVRTFHQYLYAYADPTDVTDPSGFIGTIPFDPLDPMDVGNNVHTVIGLSLKIRDPSFVSPTKAQARPWGSECRSVWAVSGRISSTRTTSSSHEIKTVSEVALGEAKLRFYLTIFNWADPTSRAKKWTAGNNFTPRRYIKVGGGAGAWAIVSPPDLGVIAYKVVDFNAVIALLATLAILNSLATVPSWAANSLCSSGSLNTPAPGVDRHWMDWSQARDELLVRHYAWSLRQWQAEEARANSPDLATCALRLQTSSSRRFKGFLRKGGSRYGRGDQACSFEGRRCSSKS